MPRARARARNVSTHCSKRVARCACARVAHADAKVPATSFRELRREMLRAAVSIIAGRSRRLIGVRLVFVRSCPYFRADLGQPLRLVDCDLDWKVQPKGGIIGG